MRKGKPKATQKSPTNSLISRDLKPEPMARLLNHENRLKQPDSCTERFQQLFFSSRLTIYFDTVARFVKTLEQRLTWRQADRSNKFSLTTFLDHLALNKRLIYSESKTYISPVAVMTCFTHARALTNRKKGNTCSYLKEVSRWHRVTLSIGNRLCLLARRSL